MVVRPIIPTSHLFLSAAAHSSSPCLLGARLSSPLCRRPSPASRSSRLSHFALLSSPFSSFRSLSSRPLRTSLLVCVSRFSPLASRLSSLVRPSISHSLICHFPRLAAYLRRRCSRVLFVRSFAHLFTRSRSHSRSRFAQLCFARSSRFCSSSCLAFSLLSPRASPLFSSRLDTPHQMHKKFSLFNIIFRSIKMFCSLYS